MPSSAKKNLALYLHYFIHYFFRKCVYSHGEALQMYGSEWIFLHNSFGINCIDYLR